MGGRRARTERGDGVRERVKQERTTGIILTNLAASTSSMML